jgi:phosphatidylserine/phosphatidylglycerophosphate/cardiolipin synthase-like enzyme
MTAPVVRIEALREQLEASLADVRLSDAEKRALTETLRAARLPEEGLRQLRNQAFELVRQHLQEADPSDPQALVRWLEGVVRALDVSRGAGGSYRAQAWFSPGDDCLKAITGQLRACRQRADICVFTLSDDRISAEVLTAHRRGVAVRLITDNEKAFDRGSDVVVLRDAGVPVRVDQSAAHMHHKFALFDQRWLLNGSYNWTRSAATENEENLVLCNDPALLRQFAQAFDALWEQLAAAT